jgi:hypothetical protein
MTLSPEENAILDAHFRALGGVGAASGARLFKPNISQVDRVLRAPLDQAIRLVCGVFATQGAIHNEGSGQHGSYLVQGVLVVGKRSLRPAAITITVTPRGETTHVHIRGVAREGLFKQRAGDEAVERIAALLAR